MTHQLTPSLQLTTESPFIMDKIHGIKAGDYGVYFCDKSGRLVAEDQIQKRTCHVSEMTNPEKYRYLMQRREQLRKDFEAFLWEQDRAGIFPIPCIGGGENGEYFPELKL